MAKKISQLTQATQVKSDDVTVIVQDGETKKLPLNMMVTKQDIENKKVAGLAKLDEIEATYENDTYTPTIAVKNKSSVKVGEGDGVDYSANVMDGHVKSAILSGQTLVNIFDVALPTEIKNNHDITLSYQVNANETYTFIVEVESTSEQYQAGFITLDGRGNGWRGYINNGFSKFTVTTSEATNKVRFSAYGASNAVQIKKCMIIKGDYTNQDIPFFTGMQSVKMPVLTTTGKNLFNPRWLFNSSEEFLTIESDGSVTLNGTIRQHKWFNFTLPKGTYYPSCSLNRIHAFWTGGDAYFGYGKKITLNETTTIKGYISSGTYDNVNFTIQVEEGSVATSYEPYKSNILTVNEPVELRGIGEVKDELNLLTGEVVQSVGVLNGEETGWQREVHSQAPTDSSLIAFSIDLIKSPNKNLLSSVLVKSSNVNKPYRWYISFNSWLVITLPKSEVTDLNGFKSWLKNNEVLYPLTEKSIKTVDLIPLGTHPSTTPYCWKDGHIQLSSSGLLPSLEYSVVTSRAGQISQNAAMIVKNDKRIFDLEILLAGGLVNTTYQALTLQNQVETGLSKVSLNSETEPDYLLYHMIMKLIEEKAYKLDDLTEKVSVFYLYEKLSDEQFETIYSALYPFAEDEIIEEPVVEELPEVVEDEVIM